MRKKLIAIIMSVVIGLGAIFGLSYKGIKSYKEYKTNKHIVEIKMNQISNSDSKMKANENDYMKALEDYIKLEDSAKLIRNSINNTSDLRVLNILHNIQFIQEDNFIGININKITVNQDWKIDVYANLNNIEIYADHDTQEVVIKLTDNFSYEVSKENDNTIVNRDFFKDTYNNSYLQGLETSIKYDLEQKISESLSENKKVEPTWQIKQVLKDDDINKGTMTLCKDNLKNTLSSMFKKMNINNIRWEI